jgi:myo-inositol-1-phosphate synthase
LTIRIALVGVGNCASSLVQGLNFYRENNEDVTPPGLMRRHIGRYAISDIVIAAAFDIDARKVGRDVNEAVFAEPNCTKVFSGDLPATGCKVRMSPVLDGVAKHMERGASGKGFVISDLPQPTAASVITALKDTGTDIVMNYLPVGSENASRFYADCALEAGTAFINSMPTLIASDPAWEQRFRSRGLPIIGDDIKSQLGATIVHRALADLCRRRGVALDRTYQLNFGGNTDFMNMLDQQRITTKKISKSEAVQSVAAERLDARHIHIGPSDYVDWLDDNKIAFIRLEGRLFGNVPMNIELRLSVEDSPNSAGVAVDMIRCAKLALDRGQGGVLVGPSAFFCKHPPRQMPDSDAHAAIERFIDGVPES